MSELLEFKIVKPLSQIRYLNKYPDWNQLGIWSTVFSLTLRCNDGKLPNPNLAELVIYHWTVCSNGDHYGLEISAVKYDLNPIYFLWHSGMPVGDLWSHKASVDMVNPATCLGAWSLTQVAPPWHHELWGMSTYCAPSMQLPFKIYNTGVETSKSITHTCKISKHILNKNYSTIVLTIQKSNMPPVCAHGFCGHPAL